MALRNNGQLETAVPTGSRSNSDSGLSGIAAIPLPADTSSASFQDHALPRACAAYWAASSELDRILLGNDDPADAVGLSLHRKWARALSKVLSLPADGIEAERAKSAVLRNAVEVVLGHQSDEALNCEELTRLLPRSLLC